MKLNNKLVAVIAGLCLVSSVATAARLTAPMDSDSVVSRIQPIGQVTVDGAAKVVKTSAPAAPADPAETTYKTFCVACHGSGIAGAPKLGDKAAWAPRIKQGMDTLVKHAIHGLRAMPPKGTCATCSDDDIKHVVEYMVKHSK